jgi:recombinational DNA repair protein RecR
MSPYGGKVKQLYSEITKGKTTEKVYKLTVTSRDNQTADTIKEMLKSQINPTEIKVGIRTIKTLRDGRVQIETGTNQEAETLTNRIRDKLGDKMETNIQRPRKPRLKIHNIPEEISTDNIEDFIIAQNPEIGLEKGKSLLNSRTRQKDTPPI